MADSKGKIAIVTGAASGIGLAIAKRAGEDGMTVVMVDLDRAALERAGGELVAAGINAVTRSVDVADRDAVSALAGWVGEDLGEVSLLVNNAGVFTPTPLLSTSPSEWAFVFGVNLWGVVNMLDAFLPSMVERDSGYVVNTSSICGVLTTPHATSYVASKHAVVALSESLFRDLARQQSNVGVTVLCPGAVPTSILRSIRHWPSHLGPAPDIAEVDYPELDGMLQPEEISARLFADIAARRFWCLPDSENYASAIAARTEDIVSGRNPSELSGEPRIDSDDFATS